MIIFLLVDDLILASMKAPPKRKGNFGALGDSSAIRVSLNESPSEKEGKSRLSRGAGRFLHASMKAPPKRKGNRNHHQQ